MGGAGTASGVGGAATSNARATSGGGAPLLLSSIATGGAGGAAGGEGAFGGDGGAATASNGLGAGSGTPDLTMFTYATGGRGGDAQDVIGMPHANGGNGGAASASTIEAAGRTYGTTLTLSQTALGGDGGNSAFGAAGDGGNATSVITLPSWSGPLSVSVAGTAIGGKGGEALGSPFGPGPEYGAPGGGGAATSQVSLSATAPASGGWNAVVNASSTAIAGMPANSPFVPDGGRAEASAIVSAYGQVTSVADATGARGGENGGNGIALAIAHSNHSAIARASATGGGSFLNPGAGGDARAQASSGYFASADALATSGSGRFGGFAPSAALAEASVTRDAAAPASPSQPSEARAHALASGGGSQVEARSSYTDTARGATVTTRGVAEPPVALYFPEAYSAANVGGAAYAAWQGPTQSSSSTVFSHASALPEAASVAPMIASSAEVAAAFADAEVLGAGTMAALYFPFTATAEFSMPFSAGQHLLLALVQPYATQFNSAAFSFSVSNGGVSLYSGSFLSPEQAGGVFNGHVLDLGVVNDDALDLLIRFTLAEGIYGFSYLVGQGGALAPIPEPGTWMLLIAGLVLLAWRGGVGLRPDKRRMAAA